jgi:hypothetical protein
MKMVLEHKHVAALAVFVVLVVVGSGFLATGNVAITNPTSHGVNLYINSVDFPARLTPTYVPHATLTNSGRQSVTFVNYRLDVYPAGGNLGTRYYTGKSGFVNLGAGETKTIELPALDIVAGTYSAVFKLDIDDRYIETDESDNTYTTTFTTSA